MVAWLAGVATYQALTHLPWRWGATLPTLGVTAALAIAGERWRRRPRRPRTPVLASDTHPPRDWGA